MENRQSQIPQNYLRFFRWFCHPDHLEELEGDLFENFQINAEQFGIYNARKQFRCEVFKMIRPSVMKDFSLIPSWNVAIYRSHGKIALRNIRRHKAFSIINITGLAIGMCVSLLVLTLLYELMQYDRFHEKKNRIYRVISEANMDNRRLDKMATSPMPLATVLSENMDDVEEVVRIRRYFDADARVEGKTLSLQGHFADNSFFEVFTFPFIEGDPATALIDPFSMVVSQKAATKLFGAESPLGKVIKMGSYGEFRITGVLKDIPKQSHLQFEVLGSFSSLPTLEKTMKLHSNIESWDDIYAHYIYFTLAETSDISNLESKINAIAESHYKAIDNLDVRFSLQSLLSIVPGPELSNKIGPSMIPIVLFILSSIAFLILLSACFNYTNLSIARSLRRAREIGIRKVVGATKGQVATQFLIESVIVALFSLLIAIGLFFLIKPGFYNIIPRAEQFSLKLEPILVLWFIAFAIFSGILAGIFPSVFLSRIKPVLTLKNVVSETIRKRFTLRKVLITFQFVISILFIAGASIVMKQYRYAFNKDLGFDRENIINVELGDMDYQVFKNEFAQIPEVKDISFCSMVAGLGSTNSTWVKLGNTPDSVAAFFISVDDAYIDNHNMKIIAGQSFSESSLSVQEKIVIVNQTFIKSTLWEVQEALSQYVTLYDETYRIIGVVEDFHYTHIEAPIRPFFFFRDESRYNIANLKIASNDIAHTLSKLSDTWDSLEPTSSWNANFYEIQIQRAYDFLKDAMKLFGFLAFLAISIACLGMLGMAMYTAETKAKEVSIRKVFGASMWNIFHSLSMNFYVLILIAAGIALPLVYWVFDQVILAQFAYRIQIGIWEMLVSLAIVFILGMLTIGSQIWQVAQVNPAEKLRGV